MNDIKDLIRDVCLYQKYHSVALSCGSVEEARLVEDNFRSAIPLTKSVGWAQELFNLVSETSSPPVGFRVSFYHGSPYISSWATECSFYKGLGFKIIKLDEYLEVNSIQESETDISELI